MKTSIIKNGLIFLTILFAIPCLAQEYKIEYEYDGAGKRVVRERVEVSTDIDSIPDSIQTIAYESFKGSAVSLDENIFERITISPNPNNGRFHIDAKGWDINDIREVKLLNSFSNIIYSIKPLKFPLQLDISTYPSGIYYLIIRIKNDYNLWKIIKK